MKTTTPHQRGHGPQLGLLAASFLTTALAFASASVATGNDVGENGNGSPGFAPGDIIGSLPVFAGGNGPSDAVNNPAIAGMKAVIQPSFLVYGTSPALKALITDATGSGFVSVYTQPGTGMQGVVFHGDVSVFLDRSVLLRSTIETNLWIGPGFGTGVGVVSFNGTAGAAFSVSSGSQLYMPLAALAAEHVLDTGLVALDLTNRVDDRAGLVFTGYGGTLRIDQDVPD